MTQTIKFAIAAGAAALLALPLSAAGAQTSGATNNQRTNLSERRICRSEVETGSLARRRRRCFTQLEWDRIARAARENAEYEFDRQRTRQSGQ